MSIMRCEKHDRDWDSDWREECPSCFEEDDEDKCNCFDNKHNKLCPKRAFKEDKYALSVDFTTKEPKLKLEESAN